jgi:two-component sensor histidine kinase
VGADLGQLLERTLAPFRSADGANLVQAGPPVMLRPRAVATLSLVIHELATNAVMHGALRASGRVTIEWKIGGEAPDGTLVFEWRESNGRVPAEAPKRRGFGMVLIERSIQHELHGTASLEFLPAGLCCLIKVPLAEVANAAIAASGSLA